MLAENGEPKLALPYGLSSSAEESDAKNISYTYTLWVGSNVTEAFSLSLISPKNTSFFKAMTQAAEMDPRWVERAVCIDSAVIDRRAAAFSKEIIK